MSTIETPTLVVLKGGLAVPVDAVRLLLTLEERGLHIRLDGEGLSIGPKGILTDPDRAGIREHRDALRDLVRYCEGVQ